MNALASRRNAHRWRFARCIGAGACLAIGSALVAGCTTAKPVVVSNHPHAFAIDCSGASLTWSHCYQKAGKACPKGYIVAQKPYKHDERITAGDVLQLFGNSAAHRRMLIECRDPNVHLPEPVIATPSATHHDATDDDTDAGDSFQR